MEVNSLVRTCWASGRRQIVRDDSKLESHSNMETKSSQKMLEKRTSNSILCRALSEEVIHNGQEWNLRTRIRHTADNRTDRRYACYKPEKTSVGYRYLPKFALTVYHSCRLLWMHNVPGHIIKTPCSNG